MGSIRVVIYFLMVFWTSTAFAAESTLATFQADITIPLGHPCMGGGISPAQRVVERLQARGFVLQVGDQKPVVVLSLDWCEVRGSAFDDWRNALAKELQTDPQRILLSSTHVHDAPVMDPEAENLLREAEKQGHWKELPAPDPRASIQLASVCWPDFNRICIQRVLLALRAGLKEKQTVTHLGLGKARVEKIASNRRFQMPDGRISYARYSRSAGNSAAAAAEEGEIDPWLRTLSFWNNEQPVCALHSYAVHPMSYYGGGEVSIDFVGLAREKRQQEQPGVFQIYATGCAGNVTAGKYNEGRPEQRTALTERLHAAMAAAWSATRKEPLTALNFRNSKIPLKARNSGAFTAALLEKKLVSDPNPFHRASAAMGLAWYVRVNDQHAIDLPVLDFGSAQVLLFPAETYVEFQLYAQQLLPESFVMCLGYGECGPGYIPIERAWEERDENLSEWTWVGPGSEALLKTATREVLGK